LSTMHAPRTPLVLLVLVDGYGMGEPTLPNQLSIPVHCRLPTSPHRSTAAPQQPAAEHHAKSARAQLWHPGQLDLHDPEQTCKAPASPCSYLALRITASHSHRRESYPGRRQPHFFTEVVVETLYVQLPNDKAVTGSIIEPISLRVSLLDPSAISGITEPLLAACERQAVRLHMALCEWSYL